MLSWIFLFEALKCKRIVDFLSLRGWIKSHLVISSGRNEVLNLWWNQTFLVHAVAAKPLRILTELCDFLHHVTGDFMEAHICHANSCSPFFLNSPPNCTFGSSVHLDSALQNRIPAGDGCLRRLRLAAFRWRSGLCSRGLCWGANISLFKNRQNWNAKCLLHTVQGRTLITRTVTEMTPTRTCWCFGSRSPLRLAALPSPSHLWNSGGMFSCRNPASGWLSRSRCHPMKCIAYVFEPLMAVSGREIFDSTSASVLYLLVFKCICFEGSVSCPKVGSLTLYKIHSLYKSFDVLYSSLALLSSPPCLKQWKKRFFSIFLPLQLAIK